jgi:uncharacterized protein (DUF2384 family)
MTSGTKKRVALRVGKPLSPAENIRRVYLRQLWLFDELHPDVVSVALTTLENELGAAKWLFSEQPGFRKIPAKMCITARGKKAVIMRLRRIDYGIAC